MTVVTSWIHRRLLIHHGCSGGRISHGRGMHGGVIMLSWEDGAHGRGGGIVRPSAWHHGRGERDGATGRGGVEHGVGCGRKVMCWLSV